MSLKITCGEATSAGVKAENEDALGFLLPDEPLRSTKGAVAVIADGMSAAEAGRTASHACVKGFLADYYSTPESWSVKHSARQVLAALNRWLYGNGTRGYGTNKGMVTTFCAVIFKSNTAYLLHVGDSRIYRLRGGDLEPLTRDHRVELREGKSYLARAMGIELNVEIDFRGVELEPGDRFLLTTDGVHEFLPDPELRRLCLEEREDPSAATDAIIQQALANGSDDNLSAQLLRIDELPDRDEMEFYRDLTKLPFPPPLEPGMVLDGYRIQRELFANKRTEVFLAEELESGGRVVIKAPSVNYEDDPEYISQFLHEEWAGRRIDNHHVLKVLERRERRTFLYYVTEYIEGQTLRQWMNDHPRPKLAEVRAIIEQIAKGLRAFHRLEMIHQDLKPENILIDLAGTVKIIDLGSTKIAGIEEIATPLEEGRVLGTVNYTAPEYHRGEAPDQRSDLFSLAVIAYEMISGSLPYDREMTPGNLKRLNYVSIKHHVPETPFWLDRALKKALALEPLHRYARLSEFTYDLSHPNAEFLKAERAPLIERNPVGFWRGLALLMLLLNLILLLNMQ